MKFKKSIILTMLLLFFCGCSVEYNLNIDKNNYNVNILVKDNKENEIAYELYKSYLTTDNTNIKDISKGNDIGLEYSSRNSLNNYRISEEFKQCFNTSIAEDENYYYLLASDFDRSCQSFEYIIPTNITINITTNHKVLESNADRVNGKINTWTLINGTIKDIEFVYYKNEFIDKEETPQSDTPIEKADNKWTYIFVGGIFLLFIISMGIIIKIKNRKYS